MGDACGLQILIRDLICSMGVWWEGGREEGCTYHHCGLVVTHVRTYVIVSNYVCTHMYASNSSYYKNVYTYL